MSFRKCEHTFCKTASMAPVQDAVASSCGGSGANMGLGQNAKSQGWGGHPLPRCPHECWMGTLDTSFSSKVPFLCGWAPLRRDRSGRGERATVRACGCLPELWKRPFPYSSQLVLSPCVYYNLIFCNISGRKLSFPSSYSIRPLNPV